MLNGQCLWYAVSGNYKRNGSKNTPMNWDTRGQFRVLDQDGATELLNPTTDNEGGAAAVIFAVGPPLSAQTGRTSSADESCGILSKTLWSAYLESATFDSSGYSTDNPLTVTRGITNGSTTNNDLIAWVTPKEIWDRFRQRSDKGDIDKPDRGGTNRAAKYHYQRLRQHCWNISCSRYVATKRHKLFNAR